MAEEDKVRYYWFLSVACSLIAVYFVYIASGFAINLGLFTTGASAASIEASMTFSSFSPFFGVFIAIVMFMFFLALATKFGAAAMN